MGNEINNEDDGDVDVVMEMMPNPPRIFVVLRIRCPRACSEFPLQIPSGGEVSASSGVSDLSSPIRLYRARLFNETE
jgi:hypothetical protein